jgi:hypothetical protein
MIAMAALQAQGKSGKPSAEIILRQDPAFAKPYGFSSAEDVETGVRTTWDFAFAAVFDGTRAKGLAKKRKICHT